jgi:hypothetical protein
MGSENGKSSKSFWSTIPGLLTGCAAIITAIAGLIGALVAIGIISPGNPPNPTSAPSQGDPTFPSPGPVGPDFLLTLEKFTYCEGDDKTPYATFRYENTGDTPFVYVLTKIIDVQTGADIYGSGEGFSSTGFHVDSDTCGVFDKATLVPGDIAYNSYALVGSPDSIESRHTARATVTLCTRPAPDLGDCVERRVDFTLYYP